MGLPVGLLDLVGLFAVVERGCRQELQLLGTAGKRAEPQLNHQGHVAG